ncbi:signal peptidase I [Candidatus Saccharibacteria bacterium]|nr:signal peptidase I [Candidatus Saccharibacteria bacterium]
MATSSPATGATAGLIAGVFVVLLCLFCFSFAVLTIIGRWKIFTKAGQEGWKSLIPIYAEYTTLKILNMEPLLCILYLIPGANFMLDIVVKVKLAKAFKKGVGFAIGLILLSGIFEMILGFGSAKFHELPSSK